MKKTITASFVFLIFLSACKKDNEVTGTTSTPTSVDLKSAIIQTFATQIAPDVYTSLSAKTTTLYDNIVALSENPSDELLNQCKQNWRDARVVWENSEAFLFGPVATENIDPRIDTWPVNFVDLEGQLSSSATFTEAYIDGLDDELKGFHPIEYLMFGQNGNKTAAEFTDREMEYLKALALNLKTLTAELALGWASTNANNYGSILTSPGENNPNYVDRASVYEEIIAAMAGICDEVANGKISEPFTTGNASLEESPFAKNSITDFRNNILGVEMVYKANFNQDGVGLEDLVRQHNLSLDGEIKLRISNAVAALNAITDPFGVAITSQPTLVQNAINAINDLKEVLEVDLMNFAAVYAN